MTAHHATAKSYEEAVEIATKLLSGHCGDTVEIIIEDTAEIITWRPKRSPNIGMDSRLSIPDGVPHWEPVQDCNGNPTGEYIWTRD